MGGLKEHWKEVLCGFLSKAYRSREKSTERENEKQTEIGRT